MGSVLVSMPFLALLRSSAPNARIIFVTDSTNRDLVAKCRIADEIVSLDHVLTPRRALQWARLALLMRRAGKSVFFDLQLHTHRRSAAWMSALSGAALRVGFLRSGDWLRPRVFDTLIVGNMFAPVHELYLQMARAIGCGPLADAPSESAPQLHITEADQQEADVALNGLVQDGQHLLLVVNPNTSGKATVRRWPLDHFRASVARILANRSDVRVVLIGTEAEFDYVERLRGNLDEFGDRVVNLAGRTSLGGLLAMLRRADCLLTNDSGPFHFGAALGTPTVGLFGPVHPDHYGRLGGPAKTVIFYRPMVCSPCVHFVRTPPCGGDNQCMQAIAPAEVSDACLSLLGGMRFVRRGAGASWRFAAAPQTTSAEGVALGVWHPPEDDEAAPRFTVTC